MIHPVLSSLVGHIVDLIFGIALAAGPILRLSIPQLSWANTEVVLLGFPKGIKVKILFPEESQAILTVYRKAE